MHIAYTHLKLLIMEVCKSDVCGRPLFANPVTIIDAAEVGWYKKTRRSIGKIGEHYIIVG